ncbi:MAG: CPBP family intramembrane glutamic endopeptidase [Chthoniobacterales bacterium]
MKDAARLLAYLAATLLFGALIAPLLFWAGQSLAARGLLPFLAKFDFETFFHRAILVSAVVFLWPLSRSLRLGGWRELNLEPNPHRVRDFAAGFLASALPLLLCGAKIIALGVYTVRNEIRWLGVPALLTTTAIVPLIEEPLFRGLILGVLLRICPVPVAMLATSALFSIVHFLKAPEHSSTIVVWTSGFVSIALAFVQFGQPMLLLAGFTTLFLIGWILADARIRTRSLWLPMGLHAGWIFANGFFNKIAHVETEILPWLGKNLLIGLVPLAVAVITWTLMRAWMNHVATAPH